METNLEKKIKKICIDLSVKLRGNQAGNGNALIDYSLIEELHSTLDVYKESIHDEKMVSKEMVFALFYTCSRFYIQSTYSNNAEELIKEFNKLQYKLLHDVFGKFDS
ncbi:hypothetical protein [Paenibacillus planticolens]|uniref:Phage gp6-like head-tail connector protein n=1 Tax=Paenibacillus planticolens TaxID=2654976 RepID=A0ABX1ZQK4_9BACL|nr:hypothetical protein [Paenibacillus planticolens]NOV01177.1 hypothetical protein [Paenibacillus planticolens]